MPETGGKNTARIPRKISDPHISTIVGSHSLWENLIMRDLEESCVSSKSKRDETNW